MCGRSLVVEEFVLHLHAFHDFFLLVLLLVLVLRGDDFFVFAEEVLLAGEFHLRGFLLGDLVVAVPHFEVLFPGEEIFNSDGGEGCEFGSFEDFDLAGGLDFFLLVGLAFHEVLEDPAAGFLDDVEDDGAVVAVEDDVVDFADDGVDVVAGEAGDGFDLVLEGGLRVVLGELEEQVDLVLQGVAHVGFAEHVELVGRGLLDHREFLQVDVAEGCELVLLQTNLFHLRHTIYFNIIPSHCPRLHSSIGEGFSMGGVYNCMAFVSQAQRNLDKIVKEDCGVGPGTYNGELPNTEIAHSYAPFFSTTGRTKMVGRQNNPGPGQYANIDKIGRPAITTYTNSTSIIIKVNSMGTQPFLSKGDRFKDSSNSIPGPGEYDSRNQSVDRSRERPQRYKGMKLLVNQKQAPSIISKTLHLLEKRIKTEEESLNLNATISFDTVYKKKGVLASTWGKDKVDRFSKKCYTEVGPGKYDHEAKVYRKRKTNPSGGFSSNSVRSVFDSIIYNTSNQDTLKLRETGHFKTNLPAPGSYELHNKSLNESQKYKNQSFGSTNKRFADGEEVERKQGFYDVDKSKTSKSFNKKGIPFNTESRRMDITEGKLDLPGPGYYENEMRKTSIIKSQIECFGSLVKRPILQSPLDEPIGPGYYEPYRCKTEETKGSNIFKSKLQRQFQQQEKVDKKFGVYDVTREDINRRVLESRIHRENLQKINCEKPGFDRQSPRFRHYQEGQKVEVLTHKQREGLYLAKKQDLRQKKIEYSREQITESKGCSIGQGGQRFRQPVKAPGVGDYSIRNNWTKKSYNVKYNPNQI